MALSRTKLKAEIEATKEAMKKIKETKDRCEDGLEVQAIVLNAFETVLKNK